MIADRSGTLLDPDPTALLDFIVDGVGEGPVNLETENEHDRAAIIDRLDRLAGDARLRKRYVEVLRDLWEAVGNRFGDQADAEATAVTWRERLAAGASPVDLLSDKHVARRPEWARSIRDAARNGTLVMTPVLCCRGGHIVAAGGVLSIAAPADAQDSLAVRRFYATEVAARLKVLSDPTRVALLSQLACDPMSVTELARLYDLVAADRLDPRPAVARGRADRVEEDRRAHHLLGAARPRPAAAGRGRRPAAAVLPQPRRAEASARAAGRPAP